MDLKISHLGEAKIPSPLSATSGAGAKKPKYIAENEQVLFEITTETGETGRKTGKEKAKPLTFERAGPRRKIYFDSSKLRVGMATCGGLCPGINNVIRTLVMELYHHYGVHNIYGFQYGFAGLVPEEGYDVIQLAPNLVKDIHKNGGSILGSSRGYQKPEIIVDTLEQIGIGLFFVIGGDGTLNGALAIYEEITKRGLKISVIGIPKTIDNDILLVERTFGFETAFSIAIQAIRAAHTEAEGYPNGIGLVKLMGRHSGYIAATAAVAEPDVNCVLIPEVPFKLEGNNGLIAWLKQRLARRGHAVIVVAEGAGQEYLNIKHKDKDPSGNVKLGDIGLFLKNKFNEELDRAGVTHSLKYIDPSYIIRSAPANANDSLFCTTLAQNAVHAGLSGRTGLLVGLWHNLFTHVPLKEVVKGRKLVDTERVLWRTVLDSTGQPHSWE